MIKPDEIKRVLSSSLEKEIDDSLFFQHKQKTGMVVVEVGMLPGYSPLGWEELKPRYEQFWIVTDHGGNVFEFKPKPDIKTSNIWFPDDK